MPAAIYLANQFALTLSRNPLFHLSTQVLDRKRTDGYESMSKSSLSARVGVVGCANGSDAEVVQCSAI